MEGSAMRTRTGIVVLLLLVAANGLARAQAPKAAVKDPELIDGAGYGKILQQYRGKPLLVTFWATWCEPCRDEYPMLNELAKQYEPKGLKVVGINLDDDGDLILMRRFLARYKPIFPNYRKKPGAEEQFRQAVLAGWTGSLPVTVLYARDGRLMNSVVGEGSHEKFETAIQSLLAAGSK
jgi:thiol-disulfide isomerase/thioredoxin